MRTALVAALVAVSLGGCGIGSRSGPPPRHYDLAYEAARPASNLGLRAVRVEAPSWLDTPALQYRLQYENRRRRDSYSESRLVASPRELVEFGLRRRLLAGDGGVGRCRLVVDLDEFVHVFDTPSSSRGIVEARARLVSPAGQLLARRSFSLARPSPTSDAQGGVSALSAAVDALAAALRDWIEALDPVHSQGLNTPEACTTPRSGR